MSDRELRALITGGCVEPEKRCPEPTEAQIEAAAKAMYEQRPKATDPKHWEAPWENVPEGWKQGQRAAARAVLEAARNVGRTDQ